MAHQEESVRIATIRSNGSGEAFDWNELDAAVDAHRRANVGQRPANCFTSRELATRAKISIRAAQGRITRMKKDGIIESLGFTHALGSGGKGLVRTYYWRVKKNG